VTPSELLSAAADRVRDLAAAARQQVDRARYSAGANTYATYPTWATAMDPELVAPHLEAWLRSTAKAVFVWEELDRPFTAAEEDAVRFAAALCPDLVEETS
jgi:hypothetical protein